MLCCIELAELLYWCYQFCWWNKDVYIIFEVFQPMWSQITVPERYRQTDGQKDRLYCGITALRKTSICFESCMLLLLRNLTANVSYNCVFACHQRTWFLIRDANTRLPILCVACLLCTYTTGDWDTVSKRILEITSHVFHAWASLSVSNSPNISHWLANQNLSWKTYSGSFKVMHLGIT